MFNFLKKDDNYEDRNVNQSGYMGIFGDGWSFGRSSIDPLAIPTYFRCISLITGEIAQTKISYITDTNTNDVKTTGLVANLLRNPSPIQNRFDFFSSLIRDVVQYGNGFAWLHNGGLYYIPNQAVFLVENLNIETPYSYKVTYLGKIYDVPVENMVHIKGILKNEDGTLGLSPLANFSTLFAKVANNEEAYKKFLENSANLSGTIETEQKMTAQVAKEMQSNFQKTYQGKANKGKVALLPNGLKFKSISAPSESDMGILEKSRATSQEIANSFGVPLALLSGLEKSGGTYSNMEQLFLAFFKYTLSPLMESITSELTYKLVPSSSYAQIIYEPDNLAFATVEQKASSISLLVNTGLLSQNEARKFYGVPTLKDDKYDEVKDIFEKADDAKEDVTESVTPEIQTKDKMLPITASTHKSSSAYNNRSVEVLEKEIQNLKSYVGRLEHDKKIKG